MADFGLKNNCLEFNGEVKRQKSGTAIGTEFAPPYAYIFMDEVETEFPKSKKLQNFLWLSYMDDMFLYELMEKEKFTQFLNELNNFRSNLKFTYETSICTVSFLGLSISLKNGAIHTDIYIKQMDGHQYFRYQSSHSLLINTSIPYSQALRVSRICCSSENDFKTYVSCMKELVLARGYPEIVVNNQRDKVVFGRDQSVQKNLESGIPFVTAYHPNVKAWKIDEGLTSLFIQ